MTLTGPLGYAIVRFALHPHHSECNPFQTQVPVLLNGRCLPITKLTWCVATEGPLSCLTRGTTVGPPVPPQWHLHAHAHTHQPKERLAET